MVDNASPGTEQQTSRGLDGEQPTIGAASSDDVAASSAPPASNNSSSANSTLELEVPLACKISQEVMFSKLVFNTGSPTTNRRKF